MTTTPTITISEIPQGNQNRKCDGNYSMLNRRAICLVKNASTFIGQNIWCDDASEYLRIRRFEVPYEIGFHILLVILIRSKPSNNCLYVANLYRNRCNKRRLTSSFDYFPPERCNLLYLYQERLERKIKM